jgi:ketosteroid isomerase-like protein
VIARTPEEAVELLDRAFEEKDIETVLSFYESAAVVVSESGKSIRGEANLRTLFEQAMQLGVSARQLKTWTAEADGIALFISRWMLRVPIADHEPNDRTFVATTVFRKQANGEWKALIDNPLGPVVLDA